MCGFQYWSSEKEDMIHLICHAISQYHVIKVSFTIFLHLSLLVAIGTVIIEIQSF